MSRGTRIGLGVVVSGVALYFASPPRSEWSNVWEAFGRVQYLYLIPLSMITAYSIYIRCQRWQLLLKPLGHVPMLPLFSATCIGFFCNMVLPLRVGEVVRPVLLGRRVGKPIHGVLGSVLLERLLDMVTILIFLGVVIALVPISPNIRRGGLAFVVLAATAIPLVVALQRRHPLALRFMGYVFSLLPERLRSSADAGLNGFIDGLQGIQGGMALLRIALYSLYLWTAIASVFAIGFIACGLPVPLVSGSLAMVTVVAGAVSAPSTPGFMGTFQLGCVAALTLFGITKAEAMPYAIVVWAVQWLTQVVLGVVFVLHENVSWREIQAAEGVDARAESQS